MESQTRSTSLAAPQKAIDTATRLAQAETSLKCKHIFQKTIWQKISKKIQSNSKNLNNFFCLVSGTTTNTFFQPLFSVLIWIFGIPLDVLFMTLMTLLFSLGGLLFLFMILLFLEPIGRIISKFLDFVFLKQPLLFGANMWLASSHGWIYTIGLNGLKNYNKGVFNGAIPGKGLLYNISKAWVFNYLDDPEVPGLGARGFIGIRLLLSNVNYDSFYLGSALWVSISNS